MKRRVYALVLVAAIGGGCAVKSKPIQTKVQVPNQWVEPASGTVAQPIAVKQWWRTFNDATLDSLVSQAIESNLDLRLATARIREARAARGVSAAAKYPTISQTDSASRVRGGFNQGITRVGGNAPGANVISPFETGVFQVGFDASWEIDLFGGVRRSVEAAEADVAAAEENRRDVLVTLLGEVARNYAELRGVQRQAAIVRKNVLVQRETRDLTEVRFNAGLATELDVARATAQVSATEAVIPRLESRMMECIHRLSVLVGTEPNSLRSQLEQAAPLPATPPEVPIGLPAELLRRRPDIRRAEAEIVAATARVAVAETEKFPKFSLTGTLGRQSTDIGGLTLGGGNFFAFGPSVRLPLFTGGRIKSNIELQTARQQQAGIRYEQAVLRALEESENALTGYARERERREKLKAAVAAAQRATELAQELNLRGLSDFLSVLDAQEAQFAAEDDLAQSETEVVLQLVALYKSLGGGWEGPDR